MLELMAESDGDVIGFRACGVLTEDDYRDILFPHLEKTLEATERVQQLLRGSSANIPRRNRVKRARVSTRGNRAATRARS